MLGLVRVGLLRVELCVDGSFAVMRMSRDLECCLVDLNTNFARLVGSNIMSWQNSLSIEYDNTQVKG